MNRNATYIGTHSAEYPLRQYIVRIGLNVGDSEPVGQFNSTLDMLRALSPERLAWTLTQGAWQGIPERTVTALVSNPCTPAMLARDLLPMMAVALCQECIAWVPVADLNADGARWHLASADQVDKPGWTLAESPPCATLLAAAEVQA
jgi:hypothetical protein